MTYHITIERQNKSTWNLRIRDDDGDFVGLLGGTAEDARTLLRIFRQGCKANNVKTKTSGLEELDAELA